MNNLTIRRAREVLRKMRDQTVVVFGDCMLDEFVWGEVTRISPEGPVPVVDIRRETVHPGGAANVLANIIALGAKAGVIGIVGRDSAGERLRAELSAAGSCLASDGLIVDESRPSTTKTRIIAHNQLVVRADREQRAPVSIEIEEQLIDAIKAALPDAGAFVVSDYDKGAVTPRVLGEVLPKAFGRGIPVLIDPKIRNFDSYQPATLVTPNHHEALRLTNTEDSTDTGLARAALLLQERLGCESVLITRGERGMLLLEKERDPVYVETAAREVYDVTGAGDTVIGTIAAAMAAGATTLEAACLANFAAGVVVGKVGTATTTASELLDAVERSASGIVV